MTHMIYLPTIDLLKNKLLIGQLIDCWSPLVLRNISSIEIQEIILSYLGLDISVSEKVIVS